jgi:CHAT domain
MQDHFAYEDFDLLIEARSRGRYRARVLRSPAGESAPVQFTVPFSSVELENFVLKVGRPRRSTRGPGRPESAPLKEFGGKLYAAVFQDELRDLLHRSLSQTRERQRGMRLRLRLADAPELAEWPWEFLYDPRLNRFLAQSGRTPLVRYLDLPDPPHPLTIDGPLRLLVMIASPNDYGPLDVEQEWGRLTGALARQQEEGQVIVERLAANMTTLRRRLRREQFHIFHFVGHGRYRPDWGDGVLVMEDRNARSHEVTGEELGGLLNEYDATRLAVLNACEGARSSASDPFAGMAQSLIQQGMPAVVAMQFEITDSAAIIFAHELYGAIVDGYPLEAALAEARGAIRDEGNTTEWGTPVLYSRAPDGRLFDLTMRARISEADRTAREEAQRQDHQEADRKPAEEAEGKAAEEELLIRAERARSSGEAGDAAAARDQYAALLAVRERVSGREHPDTLTVRSGLAWWTGEAGDAAAARDQYAALLPVRERVSGPEHPDTLSLDPPPELG